MIGRKAVIGLSLLSMLVFCAFAAPSAFAAKGTTGFTCVKVAVAAQFSDAHCTTAKVGGEGYEHVEIPPGTETIATTSNKNTKNNTTESTNAVLNATIGGLKTVITCKVGHGTGPGTNTAGAPMNVSGTGTSEFSECTGTLGGKACESVNEGKAIVIKALISTPTEAMEVKLSEDEGPFASFKIKCGGVNFELVVKGSATAIPEGTTTKYTEASTKGVAPESNKVGLFVGGQPAWFEATTTTTMSTTESGIALTTTAS